MGDHSLTAMAWLARLTLLAVAVASATASNADHVLPPLAGKSNITKLLVLIPGANVDTEYYLDTAASIQQASDLSLWVAIPAMPVKRCIILCPSTSVCAPLQSYVSSIVSKAATMGYNGSASAPDTFLAGHSLGGICAGRLAQAYVDPPYQATIIMGSYAEALSGAGSTGNFPTPLVTIGAELDGGLGRPAMIGARLRDSDEAAANHTSDNSTAWQLTNAPVVILPGMDHSSFCPGFAVPGDVFPAEASKEQAMKLVGETVAAFLSIHAEGASEAAFDVLAAKLVWTRKLLLPLQQGYDWENGNNNGNYTSAPLCAVAQKMLAGDAAEAAVDVGSTVYKSDSHEFEHTRTTYQSEPGHRLELNVSGHNDYYSGVTSGCLVPAEDIGCKMTSSDRIAQQLNISGNSNPNCSVVNEYMVHVAEQILNSSSVGRATLERFRAKGRGIFFGPDFSPFGNIGPLFVSGTIKIEDSSKGITISSITINNPVSSPIFPGVHYCKFVSPARVIDYMMIDSLKNESGCLNV